MPSLGKLELNLAQLSACLILYSSPSIVIPILQKRSFDSQLQWQLLLPQPWDAPPAPGSTICPALSFHLKQNLICPGHCQNHSCPFGDRQPCRWLDFLHGESLAHALNTPVLKTWLFQAPMLDASPTLRAQPPQGSGTCPPLFPLRSQP